MLTIKTINGIHFTIVWHVDHLKISYIEKSVVEAIMKQLNKKFGNESTFPPSRVKVL